MGGDGYSSALGLLTYFFVEVFGRPSTGAAEEAGAHQIKGTLSLQDKQRVMQECRTCFRLIHRVKLNFEGEITKLRK
jgi:hypothetical protein